MSNYGPVDKTVSHTVFYDGQEYRRYKNDGYYVLYKVVDGVVDYSTSVVEHRLVYELANGVKLDKNMQVHHINHDRSDNRPENLMALTIDEHTRLHAAESGRRLGPVLCIDCGKPLVNRNSKRCRDCARKFMQHKTPDEIPKKEELSEHILSMTNVEIARLYDVSPSTVVKWRAKYGLPSAAETLAKRTNH